MINLPNDGLPSRSYIDKCGWALVDYWHSAPLQKPMPEIAELEAVAVLNAFRRAHELPLLKVRIGLSAFVRAEHVTGVVTQRLKRRPRIIRKLARMGNSKLSRLEDIGGCRVVFESPADLQRVREHLEKTWAASVIRTRDYVTNPNASGYRALHIIVERDGRRIEVQLRTQGQQQWADAVEAADSRHELTLKDGSGPADMMEYFVAAGDVIHAGEYGGRITPAMLDRFSAARGAVVRAGYYRR
ncbi:MAG: hypothetical protein BGO26_14375 [Actinobacteria bacterium 69-20]|nr:RelA/SpoT domain-containing protein [Actinomycetota bacterium]OJV29508.1 MAG: hypothetical protein BGO26_14375 [Actinobacteria bacterium 69-20]